MSKEKPGPGKRPRPGVVWVLFASKAFSSKKPPPPDSISGHDFWQPRHAPPKTTDDETYAAAKELLRQTPTGLFLMEALQAGGYRVVFDSTRTTAMKSDGFCDVASKTIVLRPGLDLASFVLLLAHEAAHAAQHRRASDLFPSTAQRPEASFRLAFAIEADAYAQQVQVSFELARLVPACTEPLQRMRARFPILIRAADRILQENAAALSDGRLVAAVFSGFYDDFGLRSYYEQTHMSWLREIAQKRAGGGHQSKKGGKARQAFNDKTSGLKDLFHADVTREEFLRVATWRGQTYLKDHMPDIDPSAPRFSGLNATVHKDLMAFYATWLPSRAAPAVPVFGLYVASRSAPAAAKTSKTTKTQARKPAAPIKSPKNRKINFW